MCPTLFGGSANKGLQSQLEATQRANAQLEATLAAGSSGEAARLAADARRRQIGSLRGFASTILNKDGFAAASPAVTALAA
jgi:hypothetical protein